MGRLVVIAKLPKRFRSASLKKEVNRKVQVFDVYRILTSKEHVRVYRGYADVDAALYAKNQLQQKTGDTCYVVGR